MVKSSLSDKSSMKERSHNKDKLKKCPECQSVWEMEYPSKMILTYVDFPAFGLKKEICNNCKTSDGSISTTNTLVKH